MNPHNFMSSHLKKDPKCDSNAIVIHKLLCIFFIFIVSPHQIINRLAKNKFTWDSMKAIEK